MPKLTARKVQTAKEPGDYGDGEGLLLRVGPSGAKSWVLRVTVHRKRCNIGLGSTSHLSLGEAREKARELRKIAKEGGDPREHLRKEDLTFWQAAERVHASLARTWRNPKHADAWLQSLRTYAKPHFGDRPIESVGTADILKALEPIWTTKHDTAKRVRQRLERIFDWAKGAGHYPHENPVTSIKKALPVVSQKAKHRPSLPWPELPGFMEDLAKRTGTSARTLELLILTGLRSKEVRGARWEEFDFDSATWTVPGERMKDGEEHRVPLSPQAIAVVEKVRGLDDDLLFPSTKRGPNGQAKWQSVNVFRSLINDRMKVEGASPHGFRSTFRDWASERAHADWEVAEVCLAHAVGNQVARAYARSDLFDRRRELMDRWGRFASGEESGKVVKLA